MSWSCASLHQSSPEGLLMMISLHHLNQRSDVGNVDYAIDCASEAGIQAERLNMNEPSVWIGGIKAIAGLNC